MSASPAERFLRSYDSREMPRYTVPQVARYLHEPESTIRAWFFGMPYGHKPHVRYFSPILKPAGRELLSFYDAASAHVLVALKYQNVKTEDIREIVKSLERIYLDNRYPLLGRNFYKFGKGIVIKETGKRLNLTRGGQLGFRHIMDRFLRRIDFDKEKMPLRFCPVVNQRKGSRAFIVIDPDLSGGRPVIRGTGIAAEVVAERKQSGESIAHLAKDYCLSRRAIKEAVEYLKIRAA